MNTKIVEEIKNQAIRLDTDEDLDVLIETIGDANYVLLGEASHGTSEFYTKRAEITKRLIQEKGFSFIAVEGDWPSCYGINRYIKEYPEMPADTHEVLMDFKRWPTWMWANEEVASLVDWLREYNQQKPNTGKVGFYGLDVYSLWESMEEIVRYLEEINSADLEAAKRAFSCFEPFERMGQEYGVSASFFGEDCEAEVVKLLMDLHSNRNYHPKDPEGQLNLEVNALVTRHAEQYYRSMVKGGPDSWNIRDEHMVDVLYKLMNFHGNSAKCIVWEHNTHIGDARATDMADEGLVNVGQLVREDHPKENVYTIGFGTHRGTVIAGKRWGDPMEEIQVPPAQKDSWEDLMHQAGSFNKLLFLGEQNQHFDHIIGHRAIGVVYNPEYEHLGNYVPSNMAKRYDAFIHIDKTNALKPLVVEGVLT